MVINEINNLVVSNPNVALKDVANFKTSDELSYGENNVQFGESEYAKRKRVTKVVTKLTAFTALLITAIASGSYLFNSFLGADPIIENFSEGYSVNDLTFSYSFTITIENSYLTMEVYDSGIILPDVIYFHTSGTYEGEISLNPETDYVIKFVSTNGFDYSSELSKYRIMFSTNK